MTEPLTGHQIGGYQVRDLLGSGGMASVYKGYDAALDREVAIKIISTANQSADFVSRFQHEARVVARLRHPHIVQIYQFGEERGFVYMVQELLPGPTLQRRIREAARRRLAIRHVLTTISELAEALDFAHQQGVIHRDVKPGNALYNSHGQLVLTDFGIARTSEDATNTATGPGVVMGTPGYVAPEQAVSSVALTPACDIYALGVVLFELVTGRLPFEADTPMGIILKHLYDDPPAPSSLRPDLPAALDDVIARAMHKEPARRYPTAGALAQAVYKAWGQTRTTTVTTPAVRSPSRSTKSAAASEAIPTTPARSPRATRTPAGSTATRTPASGTATSIRTTPRTPTSTPRPKTAPSTKGSAPLPMLKPASNPTPASIELPVEPLYSPWPRRVGLVTLTVTLLLIVLGFNPHALTDAWNSVRTLVGY